MIIIPNKSERLMLFFIFTIVLLPSSIFVFVVIQETIMLLSMWCTGILLFLIINSEMKKWSPWHLPNVYDVINGDLCYVYHYKEGNKFSKIKLSSVEKIKFKNKSSKYLYLWLEDEEKSFKTFTAPFFEKCNDEWQRLFEEIRKRLPPEAEIIIK